MASHVVCIGRLFNKFKVYLYVSYFFYVITSNNLHKRIPLQYTYGTHVSLPMISVAFVQTDNSDFSVLSKSGCDAEICDTGCVLQIELIIQFVCNDLKYRLSFFIQSKEDILHFVKFYNSLHNLSNYICIILRRHSSVCLPILRTTVPVKWIIIFIGI